MNVQLLLEDRELELSDKVSIPLNKTFDNLTNPTDIIVDYSKSINIPMTPNNNAILGHAYRLDKALVTGTGITNNIGMYLDPSKKIPFKLLYNNSLIMEGYAKFVSANNSSKDQYYTLNLYGTLGEIIQELMQVVTSAELLPDQSGDNMKYVLDDRLSGAPLDRTYIAASFKQQDHSMTSIKDGKPSDVEDIDIIGFAPAHQGKYPDFNSDKIIDFMTKKVMNMDDFLIKYWGDMYRIQYYDQTGQYATDEQVEDFCSKLNPGNISEHVWDYSKEEFRSRCMKPFIYIDKLFQMYQGKCKELTGYEMVLDNEWFNNDNPYWTHLCYMLKQYSKNANDSTGGGEIVSGIVKDIPFVEKNERPNYSYTDKTFSVSSQVLGGNKTYTFNSFRMECNGKYTLANTKYREGYLFFNTSTGFKIKISLHNKSNGAEVGHKWFWCDPGWDESTTWPDGSKYIPEAPPGDFNEDNRLVCQSHTFDYKYNTSNSSLDATLYFYIDFPQFKIQADLENEFEVRLHTEIYFPTTEDGWLDGEPITLLAYNSEGNSMTEFDFYSGIPDENFKLSYSPITMLSTFTSNDILVKLYNFYKSDEPLFNVILQYTKMFGLIWDIDYINKTIAIKTRNTYFSDYRIYDWTNKLDRTQPYVINPVSFESKYVVFNYEDVEGYNYSNYQGRYGVPYGTKKLRTNYDFDCKDRNLFEGIYPSCVSNRTYVKWIDILNWDFESAFPTTVEKYTYIDDDDEDRSKSLGLNNWYFRNGTLKLDLDTTIVLSDDDPELLENGLSCWYNSYLDGPAFLGWNMPLFNIVHTDKNGEKYGICFNTPMRDYTYDKSVSDAAGGYIYDRYWKDYVNERYNINNKKLTAYFNIRPEDYANLRLKDFIIVDNQLFLINKIFDYDITGSSLTKCELIQVNNTKVYTNGNISTSQATITFNVFPEDATIKVNGVEIGSKEYICFNGDVISYEISKTGFKTYANVLFVQGDETINVNLENEILVLFFKTDVGEPIVGVKVERNTEDVPVVYDTDDEGYEILTKPEYQGLYGDKVDYKVSVESYDPVKGNHTLIKTDTIDIKFIGEEAEITFDADIPLTRIVVNGEDLEGNIYRGIIGNFIKYEVYADGKETVKGGFVIKKSRRIYLQYNASRGCINFVGNGYPSSSGYMPITIHVMDEKISSRSWCHGVVGQVVYWSATSGPQTLTGEAIVPSIGASGDVYLKFGEEMSETFFDVYANNVPLQVGEYDMKINGNPHSSNVYYCPNGETFTYEVSKEGFATATGEYTSNGYSRIKINLFGSMSKITFDVDRKEAIVYVNGNKLVDQSNLFVNGRVYQGYDGDVINYRVECVGFLPIEGTHTINGNETIEINFDAATASITFNVIDAITKEGITNTRITVGGQVYMEGETANLRLGQEYDYTCTALTYGDVSGKLLADSDKVFTIEMSRQNHTLTVIPLVDGNPTENAKIYINDTLLEGNVYEGYHREMCKILVTKEGMNDWTMNWELVRDEVIYANLTGDKYLIEFDIDQPNSTLYINGIEQYVNRYAGYIGDEFEWRVTNPNFPEEKTGTHKITGDETIYVDFIPRIAITFDVNVEGATVSIDLKPIEGYVYMARPNAIFTWSVSKEGYRTVSSPMGVSYSEPTTIPVTLTQETCVVHFEITPNIIGKWLRVNGEDNLGFSGTYYVGDTIQWEAGAPGYETKTGELEIVSKETVFYEIVLEKEKCLLTFNVDVDEYQIYINDQPIEGNTYEAEYGSTITYRVETSGYPAIEKTITVESAKTIRVEFIDPKCEITFVISPKDATIKINGEVFSGTLYRGDWNTSIEVEVSKPEYVTARRTIDLNEDKTVEITLAVQTYQINFQIDRPDTTLYLNGEVAWPWIYIGPKGEIINYRAVPQSPGYKEVSGSHMINGDATVEIITTPTYTVTFNVTPSDANIDCGLEYPVVNKQITVPYNTTIRYEISKSGYETVAQNFTVLEDSTITVVLQKKACTLEFDIKDDSNQPVPNPTVKVNSKIISADIYGRYIYEGSVGDYCNWEVSAVGYTTQKGAITLRDVGREVVAVEMENLRSVVTFDVRPQDALIKVNGQTILGNTYIGQKGETISFTAEADGYKPYESSKILTQSEELIVIIMEGVEHLIEFDIDDPTGATIFVNDVELPANRTTALHGETINWRVEKSGYSTKSGSVVVEDDMTIYVDFLPRIPITFNVNTSDYTITVNGEVIEGNVYYARANQFTYWTVSKPGWSSKSGSGVYTEATTIDVELVEQSYTITFSISPDNMFAVNLIVDGVNLFSERLVTRKYGEVINYEVRRSGYETVTGVHTVIGNKTIYINLIKTKAAVMMRSVTGLNVSSDECSIQFNVIPSDSTIKVNDNFVSNGIYIAKKGEVINYEISKLGYISEIGSFTAGKNEVINIDLKSNYYIMKFNTNVEGVKLIINGNYNPVDNKTYIQTVNGPKNVTYQISKPGYKTLNGTIEVQTGDLYFELVPENK